MLSDLVEVPYVDAAKGDAPAYLKLMDAAETAARTGTLDVREGLAAAELFGRYALCLGHQPALVPLARVLFTRCHIEHVLCGDQHGRGCAAAAHALRYLNIAADGGDEDAASAVYVMGNRLPGGVAAVVAANRDPDRRTLLDQYDQLFADAARGDEKAACEIITTLQREAENGSVGDLETFAIAEGVTSIGVAAGHLQMAEKLANVMLLRRAFELQNGRTHGHDYLVGKVLSIVVRLKDLGYPSAPNDLRAVLDHFDETTILAATKAHPGLLAAINEERGR